MSQKKFAIIGVGGYVARRHLAAIKSVGGDLVAAVDVHDSVGILDAFFPQCRFYKSPSAFEGCLDAHAGELDYVVVCSPNHLHAAQCESALHAGADVICEKPLALRSRDVERVMQVEADVGRRVYPILQLRLHPGLIRLREAALATGDEPWEVEVSYVTPRGRWYASSWKGDESLSGGIVFNIGVHVLDALVWVFGQPLDASSHVSPRRVKAKVAFERAAVELGLSICAEDLPASADGPHREIRARVLGGAWTHVDLSHNFVDLHTAVYERVLRGEWPTAEGALRGIELTERLSRG